jgi:GTP pyrophosphokinase
MEGTELNDQLYAVLGLIHSKWKPMANRFKDYAAVPKPNGYRSLHTTVIGLSPKSLNQPTEVQIRTRKMHEEAENGIASHWLYESNKKSLASLTKDSLQDVLINTKDFSKQNYINWLEALSKTQNEIPDDKELVEALKLDVFNDRIFVFTPTGTVKDLPAGSTPVDFAYAVHSDIGNRCQLAKANGVVVPLNYELKNGEVVEIVTNNKTVPKPHWLSFVKSAGARNKIRAYLRSLDKERSFREGKELINKILIRKNKPLLDEDLSLLREYGGSKLTLRKRIALVEEIGNGSVLATVVLKKVFGEDEEVVVINKADSIIAALKSKLILPRRKAGQATNDDEIFIAGARGVPYRFANCCKPGKNKPILAYVTRGHAVSIHLQNCKVLRDADQRRIVSASWGKEKDARKFPVKVTLRAKNRTGLIRDITEVINQANVNILDFGTAKKLDKDIERDLVLEISDNEQFLGVLERLQRIRDVFDVARSN